MGDVTKEQMIQAIYGQESRSGKADTSKENYAGARGPMQVTRDTFEGMKRNGMIPADYRHDNPAHTQAAGNALVGQLYDKFGGDPRKVAAAYYAGEKAIRADGTINDFRDRKNPNAPTTLQYADQVLGRLGATSTPAQATAAPVDAEAAEPTARFNVLSSWDQGMPDRLAHLRDGTSKELKDKTAAPIQGSAPVTGEGVTPLAETIRAQGEAATARNQAAEDIPFQEMAKSASTQHTLYGTIYRNEMLESMGRDYPVKLGYSVDAKELAGKTAEEQEFLKSAHSPEHLEILKADVAEHQRAQQELGARGMLTAMGATVVAGAPEDITVGAVFFQMFKLAKLGSALRAAKGARASAIASNVAENVMANVAITAAQEKLDPYMSGGMPYVAAVGSGILGSTIAIPGIYRAAAWSEAQGMLMRAAERDAQVQAQAVRNVGAEAPEEVLHAEVRRLESNAIRQDVAAATSIIPEHRRLLPDNEALRPDMPEVKAPEVGAKAKPTSEALDIGGSANEARVDAALRDTAWKDQVKEVAAIAPGLPNGVHVLPSLLADPLMQPAVRAARTLVEQMLPKDTKVIFGKLGDAAIEDGRVISAGKTHFIGLSARDNATTLFSAVHEVGHVVFITTAKDIPAPMMARLVGEWKEFGAALKAGDPNARFKRFNENSRALGDDVRGKPLENNKYVGDFEEYTAEAFVRWTQRKAREADGGGLKFDSGVLSVFKNAWDKVKQMWDVARGKGWVAKDEAYSEYFQSILDGTLKGGGRVKVTEDFLDPNLVIKFSKGVDAVESVASDPLARKIGVDLLPMRTPAEMAEAQAILALHKKAEAGDYKVDEGRLSRLLETTPFQGAQSTANTMLRSDNAVVRMVAAELLESPSGAGGRRSNAAIAKHMNQQQYLGNTMNEYQSAYAVYRKSQGATVMDDVFGGKQKAQFDRLVAEEIESRRPGAAPVDSPAPVKAAADSLEMAYERMRLAQIESKTVGWAALPESSVGYMPHRLSPEKFINMTNAQAKAMHSALTDQFIRIEGFDMSFADGLASKYMDRVRVRAHGGFDSPGNIHQVGAADMVEDALRAMGLEGEQVKAMMGKYTAGAAAHTKKRLNLDLNQEHMLDDGSSFKLLDLYETDQFKLLRSQAMRVSGETALARHGVMGTAGLKLLRRAMEFGADGSKATSRELKDFDQVAAEFLGQPFGTQSQFLDRVLQANSLARLGGMGFTQMAEAINGVWHVGVLRSMEAVGSMARLRSEIKALARGETVDNPVLKSLEKDGVEFGTADYKTVFPFDSPSLQYTTYGKDTITAGDRLLRGGAHIQAKLSLWKTIHSTQQRGFAEQIVRKAVQYLRDGKSGDAALKDMGFNDDLLARLRQDLPSMAEFNGNRLTNFDITKATDKEAAADFVQNVHRGVSQIIQETFIGERGRWAHDATMKFMTQFRTFSLTSVEKQWVRQLGNQEGNEAVKTAKVLGMMLGSMSVAAPIYMARTYLASVGRADQQEYLDKQLAPERIARATLNYIAVSGLSGDLLDAASTVAGKESTGGRTGVSSNFVGTQVAPAVGLVDDLWKAVQNTKEGTDPKDLIKALPFSRIPLVIPALNALTAD